jgi:diacylglycerol kinase (ATP)
MNFSITKRAQSFIYAFRGIGTLIKTQHNVWIHLVATVSIVTIAFLFGLSGFEWTLIIMAIIIVWLAEALNTAIEYLSDALTKEQHPLIAKAKDVAAGGVLIAAAGASLIGVIVFWPYIKQLIYG